MDRADNLWSRRAGNSKLSLSTNESNESRDSSARVFPSSKSSHGGKNPFNSPLTAGVVSSPAGTSNFGLGTGAFASFGSANKTPKTPGTAFDWGKATSNQKAMAEKVAKAPGTAKQQTKEEEAPCADDTSEETGAAPLVFRYAWVIHFRPPTSKNVDYEASIQPMCRMENSLHFWQVYRHLRRPSMLPQVSDYHFFREGIRPVWEDPANKKGGKWILRLKKGVADRYWEDLLIAMVGDQFMEAHDEVCGAVVSVRAQEDVMSIWTKNDGGRNVKIRETIKRVLNLPSDTVIVWKSHDDSISQRTAIDQARTETKRRATLNNEDATATS